MKIGIDVSPLETGHKVRGVGFYLENLKKSLVKYFPDNEFIFFKRGEKLPRNLNVVHFPYFEPFFLALPLYKRYKTVVTVHDLTPIVFPKAFPRGLKGQIKWQMQRYALRKANAIITDSENSKADIIKYVKVRESKVNVVYLAAGEEFKRIDNKELLSKTQKKFNLAEKFALYVGDVTWNKNLPRLIDAVKEADIPLVMVGKALTAEFDKTNPWNKDLVRVHEQIDELKVNNKNLITTLGFLSQEDLVAIYNLATVFVMPSLYEGFGLPILEAQACGLPVVTTKQGSIPEVAKNSVYFVDAFDYKGVAKGIKEVFESQSLQEELRQRGLENVKRFSWKNTAEKTLAVYKNL